MHTCVLETTGRVNNSRQFSGFISVFRPPLHECGEAVAEKKSANSNLLERKKKFILHLERHSFSQFLPSSVPSTMKIWLDMKTHRYSWVVIFIFRSAQRHRRRRQSLFSFEFKKITFKYQRIKMHAFVKFFKLGSLLRIHLTVNYADSSFFEPISKEGHFTR